MQKEVNMLKKFLLKACGAAGSLYCLNKLSSDITWSWIKLPEVQSWITFARNDFSTDCAAKEVFSSSKVVKSNKEVWDKNWDKMESVNKSEAQVVRTLLFIRHGDYFQSEGHELRGHLNPEGIKQAIYAGKRLKEMVNNGLQIDKFVISTMPRAKESFEAIQQELNTEGIKIETSDIIREGYPCVPVPYKSRHARPEYVAFRDWPRFEAGFRSIFYRPGYQDKDTFEVYVCHANLIRYLVMRALQMPEQAWLRFSLKNASFTQLRVLSNGVVVLDFFGERGHVDC